MAKAPRVGFPLLLAACTVGFPVACLADHVRSADGDIVLERESGPHIVLTRGKHDIAPTMSHDGKVVVLLRTIIPPPEPDGDGAYELVALDLATRREQTLYRPPDVSGLIKTWATSAQVPLEVSPDGRLVYFSRREAPTSFQVVQVERRTRRVSVVYQGAGGFRVLESGPHRGQLLVSHRELAPDGEGFIYLWCLLDAQHNIERKWPVNASIDDVIRGLGG